MADGAAIGTRIYALRFTLSKRIVYENYDAQSVLSMQSVQMLSG